MLLLSIFARARAKPNDSLTHQTEILNRPKSLPAKENCVCIEFKHKKVEIRVCFFFALEKMLTNESNDEIDDRIKSKYVHICEQLDIDELIVNSTWDNYRSIRNDHTLEVSEHNKFSIFPTISRPATFCDDDFLF